MKLHEGQELGPIMEGDKLLLQALIKQTNPMVLVELGHFWGASARAMLEVMDEGAVLHSYDNTKNPDPMPNFIFHSESQEKVAVDNIDFIFLDASHNLHLNQETWKAFEPNLTPKAIVAVHDTGTWVGGNVFDSPEPGKLDQNGNWVHCPDELEFVDWLKVHYPEYEQIHIHSSRKVRHGITLLQKYTCLL